jgi:predicted phosphoribosyltransferase
MDNEVFRDRQDAGRRLADRLLDYKGRGAIVLAIPRGGVPVGFEIAESIEALLDVIVLRKIPIPWNPEAGFGAVTADGTVVLNDSMVRGLQLTDEQIRQAAEEVREEIVRRTRMYRKGSMEPSDVADRPVILVDDGLASGYTMLAAIKSLEKHKPSEVVVAVPVASSGAARLVRPRVDRFIALIVGERIPFAVADFYQYWSHLTDEEVLQYLEKAKAKEESST